MELRADPLPAVQSGLEPQDSRSTVLRTIYVKVTVKSPSTVVVCLPANIVVAAASDPSPVQSPAQPRHAGSVGSPARAR